MSLTLLNQTHGTVEEGAKKKSHIVNDETGMVLCGRQVWGNLGAEVDYDYLVIHPVPMLAKNICINCLSKALDIIKKEIDEEEENAPL